MFMKVSDTLFPLLEELKLNNNRDWFSENKSKFQQEDKTLKLFFNEITNGLNTFDEIETLKIFRIYRDVRFSKNKVPYKTNRSANWIRAGVHRRGSYYLQLEPGNSFIGCGFFEPNPADLLRIRKEFETDDTEIRDILKQPEFKKVFDGLDTTDQVKTAPKGFDKNHKAIDLIKNKNFFVAHYYADKEVLSTDFIKTILYHFQLVQPYFKLMSDVLTTDLNGASLYKH
ncbi:MAG: TIGR02453 family protein [Flavobacteriaceae bacterium CG18_big_fil_WC_8_21_14_2_50_34_36]|nr:DUF2461 domain-containing protein [Flavobacteriia bacterium]PIQ17806.1 MAG: TIGR02453 family protein [Flavobacteriaceae bacterium CG18_big_fil_WC_8_21_14_2_50_34_36]PIV50178.1 MAG: TIGR02453 family protein [Flavobacteriaceae bacterium CG02_land_8_20_14_3_00_34_13]PIZ08862.1 MAG: TIGR02453 family protein [Flavobacteriaceae bacterium CG_4_10_14_0_8_um_filter_34_31]PJC06491.1 MAG: TIGR02453 family protein [Flavobacteriaceae bacterium CG_4_9_14_0_8_um_filter_34_30]